MVGVVGSSPIAPTNFVSPVAPCATEGFPPGTKPQPPPQNPLQRNSAGLQPRLEEFRS